MLTKTQVSQIKLIFIDDNLPEGRINDAITHMKVGMRLQKLVGQLRLLRNLLRFG